MANISINPNTYIKLVKVPLESDYKNTFTFSTLTNQSNYFNSLTGISFNNYTYVRKDTKIRVEKPYDEICNYNYLYYDNNFPSSKRYYCFITRMEYVNENATDVYIQIDVMQTYYFDITWNACFVEREHVNDDVVGLHTIPENLETGEYICNMHDIAEYSGSNSSSVSACDKLYVIVGVTVDKDGNDFKGGQYDGIYSGLKYYGFPCTVNGFTELKNFINLYPDKGKSDAIICMFLAPEILLGTVTNNEITQKNYLVPYTINKLTATSNNKNITFSDGKIDNYEPRNNKLQCYPFNYLIASNNNGIDVLYKLEDFFIYSENGSKILKTPEFKIEGCLTPGCSVRMIPINYKNSSNNDSEGINLGKFPCLNWNSDVYTNWLTQNGVNIGLSIVGSGLQIAGGVGLLATGKGAIRGASNIASGILGIGETLGQIYQHSLMPPQSEGNTNCGDVITASNRNDFHFYRMSIRKEMAIIIDKYFDMFGYKVNNVKIPNITGRPNWNYVKTIDCNCDGDIPNENLEQIRENMNNGITFWHNPSNIYNYELNNNNRTI